MTMSSLLRSSIAIAQEAADLILRIYQAGNFEQLIKNDDTPVTSADLAAHEFITTRLRELTPDIPVLSEEDSNIPLSAREDWSHYWLIDPLDGTQEFIAGSGDFATIIALVKDNEPWIGVVCCPVTKVVYYAEKEQGAWKLSSDGKTERLNVRHHNDADLTSLSVAISRRQNTQMIRDYLPDDKHYELIALGSASLKACLVAEGGADFYLRVGPTGEWDTAATQCIVEEAGGRITNLDFTALTYNRRESLENPNFIVSGDQALPWSSLVHLKESYGAKPPVR